MDYWCKEKNYKNKQTKQLNQNLPSAPRIQKQGLYIFCYLPYRQGDRGTQTGKLVFSHIRLTPEYQQVKMQIKSYIEFAKT